MNSKGVVLLICGKMAFHTDGMQIVLTEINSPSCTAMRHELEKAMNAAEKEPKGDK